MATSRVRHRGQPPRDVDHGPANGAGGVTTLGAHAQVARIAQAEASRLVEVGGRMPDGGAGKIERSMATEAQRAAWRAAEQAAPVVRAPVKAKLEVDGVHAKGSAEERAAASKVRQADYRAREADTRPAMGSAEHIHASRMRGAVRHLEVVAARRPEPRRSIAVTPSPVTSEEEPVMPIDPPPVTEPRSVRGGLQAVADAAGHAAAARAALDGALHASRAADAALAAAEIEWDRARVDLEAAWRATGIGEAPPTERPTGIPEMARGRVLVDEPALDEERQSALEDIAVAAALRDDRLGDEPADDAPEVLTRPRPEPDPSGQPAAAFAEAQASAGGGPGLSASQERMLAAVRTAGGNLRDAAAALGVPGQAVQTSLRHIGEKGGIPIDLISLLPAGYAKYRPAGI